MFAALTEAQWIFIVKYSKICKIIHKNKLLIPVVKLNKYLVSKETKLLKNIITRSVLLLHFSGIVHFFVYVKFIKGITAYRGMHTNVTSSPLLLDWRVETCQVRYIAHSYTHLKQHQSLAIRARITLHIQITIRSVIWGTSYMWLTQICMYRNTGITWW
jgi:hypothetical protein